jgi:hypothetical protein
MIQSLVNGFPLLKCHDNDQCIVRSIEYRALCGFHEEESTSNKEVEQVHSSHIRSTIDANNHQLPNRVCRPSDAPGCMQAAAHGAVADTSEVQ